MGFVIEGFVIVLIVTILLGLVLMKKSVKLDDTAHGLRLDAERKAREEARADARKYEPGEPLVCLNCTNKFKGPLTESGCPACRNSTLVLTEAQYAKMSETVRSQFNLTG